MPNSSDHRNEDKHPNNTAIGAIAPWLEIWFMAVCCSGGYLRILWARNA